MARPGHHRNTASPAPNNRGGPVVQPADRLRGVEGHAVGDAAAAVVSGDVEAGEAWSLQEPDAVLRYGPLAVARPLPYEERPDEVLAVLRDFHAPSRFEGEPAVST
jgi:hypothetical protein